jgi:hypothetical protein
MAAALAIPQGWEALCTLFDGLGVGWTLSKTAEQLIGEKEKEKEV